MPQVAISGAPLRQAQVGGVSIRSYRVDVTIKDQIARTRIEQVFVNEGAVAAEGTYVFPLPPGVTITDLVMVVDGQPFRAHILEKEEAQSGLHRDRPADARPGAAGIHRHERDPGEYLPDPAGRHSARWKSNTRSFSR